MRNETAGDLISRSALLAQIRPDDPDDDRSAVLMSDVKKIIRNFVENAPAVDAVAVTAQELQFLIDAMYRHIRWMIAGRLDKPECSYDERVALLERLTLFEREHFPDMQAEAEG